MAAFAPLAVTTSSNKSSFTFSKTSLNLRLFNVSSHSRPLSTPYMRLAAAPPDIHKSTLSKQLTTSPTHISKHLEINSNQTNSISSQLIQPPSRREHKQLAKGPLREARALLAKHDYDGARNVFENHFSQNDNNTLDDDSEAIRSWAYMEGEHGDETRARELFSRAIDVAKTPAMEAAAWNAWALMEQRKGKISIARKCYVNGYKVDPAHIPLCQAFAMFEAKYGLKRRARELFSRTAELNKDSHRTWVAWANFEAAEDNMAKARMLFNNAITNAQGEDGIPAILAYAKFEEKQKQFSKARDLYKDGLLKYGKQCPKILHAWATLESHSGNYEKSRQLFLATLGCPGMSGEETAPTYQAWAMAEKRAGNISNARKLFARGAEANPRHPYIWQAWGIMEHRCKNIEAARKYFQQGVELNPNNGPTWGAWARLEAGVGNIDKARDLYNKAAKMDTRNSKSLHAWAVLEGKQGNLEMARKLFRKVVAANPTSAPAWQAWACMEEGVDNIETARELFQKGVDADPTHIAVWQAWKQMEDRLGEWDMGPACSLPAHEPF